MIRQSWFTTNIHKIIIILKIVDKFIERIIASDKFNKIAEIIADKTIQGLRNLENNYTDINYNVNMKDADEKQIRRNSEVSEEIENQTGLNNLSGLSLKYKKLIKDLKKEPQILNTTELLRARKETDLTINVDNKNTNKTDISVVDESLEFKQGNNSDYENDSDEAAIQEDDSLEKSNAAFIEEDNQKKHREAGDLFSSKQKDLHGRKTVRRDGDDMFVFQSSSDYNEYHENVNKVLKNNHQ